MDRLSQKDSKMNLFIVSSLTMFSILLLTVPYVTPVLGEGPNFYPMATKDAWPMFGGGVERSSFSPWDGPIQGGKEWSVKLGANMGSAPSIVDGVVYLGQNRRIVALDLTTGEKIWSFKTEYVVSVHPLVHNGMVIFNGEWGDGELIAVNKDTGKFIWSARIGSMYTTSPLAVGDIIYTATNDNGIYALDAKTGSIIWNNSKVATYMHSSIAYHDGILYCAGIVFGRPHHSWVSEQQGVFAMNAATQEILWTTDWEGYPSSVVYSDGRVIIKTEGKVIVYNASDGGKVWQSEYEEDSWNAIESTPAVGLGLVFGGAQIKNKDNFRCYSLLDGSLLWSRKLEGGVISTPVVAANGIVYVHAYGSSHSHVYAMYASNGTILWIREIESSTTVPLALANGILLVAGGSSLTAFSDKEVTSDKPHSTITQIGILALMFSIEGLIAVFMMSRILGGKKKRRYTGHDHIPRDALLGGPDNLISEPPSFPENFKEYPSSPKNKQKVEAPDDEKNLL